jgi:hypothetical protein
MNSPLSNFVLVCVYVAVNMWLSCCLGYPNNMVFMFSVKRFEA